MARQHPIVGGYFTSRAMDEAARDAIEEVVDVKISIAEAVGGTDFQKGDIVRLAE